MQLNTQGKMTFLERMFSFLMYGMDIVTLAIFNYYQNIVYKRNFPADKYISFQEAMSNVSLILINNHFSQDHIRPYIPGMIEVGGLQIKTTPSPLPKVKSKFSLRNYSRIFYPKPARVENFSFQIDITFVLVNFLEKDLRNRQF
jgi:hypothetical protein